MTSYSYLRPRKKRSSPTSNQASALSHASRAEKSPSRNPFKRKVMGTSILISNHIRIWWLRRQKKRSLSTRTKRYWLRHFCYTSLLTLRTSNTCTIWSITAEFSATKLMTRSKVSSWASAPRYPVKGKWDLWWDNSRIFAPKSQNSKHLFLLKGSRWISHRA